MAMSAMDVLAELEAIGALSKVERADSVTVTAKAVPVEPVVVDVGSSEEIELTDSDIVTEESEEALEEDNDPVAELFEAVKKAQAELDGLLEKAASLSEALQAMGNTLQPLMEADSEDETETADG